MTIRKSKPERRRERERDSGNRHHRQKSGHSYRNSVDYLRQSEFRALNSRSAQRHGTTSSGSSSSSISGSSIPETYPFAENFGWPRNSAQNVEQDDDVDQEIDLWHKVSEDSPSDKNNSDDEYRSSFPYNNEKDFEFSRLLRESKGYEIFFMAQDGACLFRAVAHQIFGDASMHGEVRRLCIDYISLNRDYFSQFITEDFDRYIERKRKSDCYGNHVELQAISEMYNRPLEIYRYSVEPQLLTPQLDPQNYDDGSPIRLSYHQEGHYNSVVDPYKATIGVGLGLPGHQPGSADRLQVDVATKESELLQIEEAMLKDKMKETNSEAVQEQIEKQVAAESFIEWMKKKGSSAAEASDSGSFSSTKLRCKVQAPASCSKAPQYKEHCSYSAQSSPHSPTSSGNKRRNSRNSPPTGSSSPTSYGATASALLKAPGASPKTASSPSHPSSVSEPWQGVHFDETASLMNSSIPFELKELDDFVLRQVLIESEREYWLQLTRGKCQSKPENEAGCSKD